MLLSVTLPLQVKAPPFFFQAACHCCHLRDAAVTPLLHSRYTSQLFSKAALGVFVKIGNIFRSPRCNRKQVTCGLIRQYGVYLRGIFVIIGNYLNVTPIVSTFCPCLHCTQNSQSPSWSKASSNTGRLRYLSSECLNFKEHAQGNIHTMYDTLTTS